MTDFFAFGSGGLQETAKQLFAKLKPLLDGKYTKPANGIPASDMAPAVQASLGKADTALQAVPNTYRTADAQDVIDSNKAPVILDTASGSVASFPDGADGPPLKTLSVNIEPVQSGTGDPSPTNVLPISGWTGCNVTRTGKNLLNNVGTSATIQGITWTVNDDGSVTANGTAAGNSFFKMSNAEHPLFLRGGTTVIASGCPAGGSNAKYELTITALPTGGASIAHDYGSGGTTSFSEDVECGCQLCVRSGVTVNNIKFWPMVRLASDTNPAYVKYATVYLITFPISAGTVYSGTLTINEDGSGELRARPYYASYNGGALVGPWVSSMDVYAPGTTPTIGAQVVDLGGEESVYPITAQQITTLLSTNNIWADCGDVEVTYRADTKLFVEKNDAGLTSQINQKAAATSVPNAGSISSTGVISIKHNSTELFTVQLPLYNGGVSNGT